MTTGQKIKYYRENNGWTQQELGEKIGVGKAAVSLYEKDNSSAKKVLKQLAELFGVTTDHLLSDEAPSKSGEKKENSSQVIDRLWDPNEYFQRLPDNRKRLYVPFYEVEITAGKFELFMDIEEIPSGYVYAPEFSGCVSCRVKGDSMYDRIYPGATAFIYYIKNKKYIDFGQIYLVVLDGYRVLKYIFPHADPKKVVLVSQNKTYPDWEVDKEDILHLFLVKGYWNQTAN